MLASGVTAIAGFAVLVFTDIRMLRDFGLVTVFDLAVALVGVLLVLPAALVWSEGGFEPLAALAARAAPPRPPGRPPMPGEDPKRGRGPGPALLDLRRARLPGPGRRRHR